MGLRECLISCLLPVYFAKTQSRHGTSTEKRAKCAVPTVTLWDRSRRHSYQSSARHASDFLMQAFRPFLTSLDVTSVSEHSLPNTATQGLENPANNLKRQEILPTCITVSSVNLIRSGSIMVSFQSVRDARWLAPILVIWSVTVGNMIFCTLLRQMIVRHRRQYPWLSVVYAC